MEIKLGNLVKDVVSDFSGIVVSKVEYLTGCTQYAVQSKIGSNGTYPDAVYFDHKRLIVIDNGIDIQSEDTGGTMRDCPK